MHAIYSIQLNILHLFTKYQQNIKFGYCNHPLKPDFPVEIRYFSIC